MSKSRRRVRKGSMAVMLCITLVSLTGCQDVAITEQVNQEITVEVTNPVRDTILIENSFIGTIEPSSEVVVTPKIGACQLKCVSFLFPLVFEGCSVDCTD